MQIAQQPRVPRRICQLAGDRAGAWIDALPELDEILDRITRRSVATAVCGALRRSRAPAGSCPTFLNTCSSWKSAA